MGLRHKFNRSEPGLWLSGAAHAGILIAGLVAYSAPQFPDAQEGIAVEVVTENQFSQITKGEEDAKQAQPDPKPRVDRVAEKAELRDPGEAQRDVPAPPTRPDDAKAEDQEELAAVPPPPPPPRPEEIQRDIEKAEAEAKAAEAKAQAQAEARAAGAKARAEAAAKAAALKAAQEKEEAEAIAKAEAEAKARAEAKAKAEAEARRVAEAKAKAEAEAKRIAEAKEKAEAEAKRAAEAKAKAEAEAEAKRVAEAKAKAEAKRVADAKAAAEAKAKRQAQLAEKFDPSDIRQLLQSKEKAASSGATGAEVNRTAALGTATGTAQKLNPSMRDALAGIFREQIERCYMPPPGTATTPAEMPVLDVRFNVDGSLATEPRIQRAGSKPIDRAVADAALRAVRRCAPYRVPARFAPFYEDWKYWLIEFDPAQT
ncbi:cell envelope integrity protein TolA [Microvirga massiliensis]|uniref:cell envelope integrity protein TolA n=1 Tax=Microvirga massiliensis TaxID=1033741 RepID=UPI00062BECC1